MMVRRRTPYDPSGPTLRLVALVLTTALAGCVAVGPDYESPDASWLKAWETDLYGRVVTPAVADAPKADLRAWWRLFGDPKLDGLVAIARANNPTLRIAGLRILESRAALGIASALRYPQLQQADGNLTYVDSHKSKGSDDRFFNYQAGMTIGWELDFWGRFQRGIESADAAFASSIFDQQNAQVLLTAQVTNLYYAYRTILLRIEIARKNAAIRERSFGITSLLYEKGQKAELDLQRAKTQYLSTLATIPSLQIQQVQVRNALCVLLGRLPGALPELEDTLEPLPTLDPVGLAALPAELLLRRPDIRSAAARVAIQSAQIGFAKADLYPRISLFGNLSYSGNTLGGAPESLVLGIGPAFTWDLFNYGRIKSNVRVQDARLQQLIELFQDTLRRAARELDDAAIGIAKTMERKVPQSGATVAAFRSLELANRRYQEGYENFQSVLDAQRQYESTLQTELINDSDHISAVIGFYAALGGGWRPTPTQELIPEPTRERMEARSDWDDLLRAPIDHPAIGADLAGQESSSHD